jgi:Flp pilus assembly protein TadD
LDESLDGEAAGRGEPNIGGAGAASGAPERAAGGIDTNFKGRALEPAYAPLAQAVRSGRVEAIYTEASKILSANQYDPVALNALALQYLRRSKPGAAKLLLNKALEKNPPSAALLNNLGVVLLAEADQELAVAEFRKALRLDDKNGPALGNLGSIYAAGGDWAKAKPLLEQAYRANKANAAIAVNYAIALRGGKDYAAAEQIYRDVIARDPRNAAALLDYSILLIDFMNRPKEGLQYVYKIRFLDPDKKEIVTRANALEKKAQSEVK